MYSFLVISFVFPIECNKYMHGVLLATSLLSALFYNFSLTEGVAYYGNKCCLYSVTKDEDVRFSLQFTVSVLAYKMPSVCPLQCLHQQLCHEMLLLIQ